MAWARRDGSGPTDDAIGTDLVADLSIPDHGELITPRPHRRLSDPESPYTSLVGAARGLLPSSRTSPE